MDYEIDYVFQWKYYDHSAQQCYTQVAHFTSELDRNRLALEWFGRNRSGEITLLFAQKRNLETWRTPLDKSANL